MPDPNLTLITENTHGYKVAMTWRDRLRARLLPYRSCDMPEAPSTFKDLLTCRVRSHLSFADRIRILMTGWCEVELRVATENSVGKSVSKGVIRPGIGKI